MVDRQIGMSREQRGEKKKGERMRKEERRAEGREGAEERRL